MNSVLSNINTASGRPDDVALQWVQQASDENITDEQLCKVPPEFVTLSGEVMAKLQNMATGELGRNITQIVEDWLKAAGQPLGSSYCEQSSDTSQQEELRTHSSTLKISRRFNSEGETWKVS